MLLVRVGKAGRLHRLIESQGEYSRRNQLCYVYRSIRHIHYLTRTKMSSFLFDVHKSVNSQYNTLSRLDDGTNKSFTKRLMFQVIFFFMISCKILCKNPFNLFSYFFYKITKIKIKSFECPKSIKSIKKYLEHQILGRRFVGPIVQATQRNIL